MTDAELRALAEAATPGPWTRLDTGSEGCSVVASGRRRVARLTHLDLAECRADAAYIAAANPQTVLALLDRIAALEKALALSQAQLGQFGVHNRNCPARFDARIPGPCGCGLSAALAAGEPT